MGRFAVNRKSALRRISPALAACALVAAGSGIAYATTSSPTVTTRDAIHYTDQATPLSSTGQVETTVAKMTLPAGNWIVHADDSVDGNGDDIARCGFVAPGVLVLHATQIGPPYVTVATVSATIGLKLTSPTVVRNTCEHDTTGSGYFYVDRDATMWAHKVGSLTINKP